MSHKILFATGNRQKFLEARRILSPFGIEITMVDAKVLEVQSDSLEVISSAALREALKHLRRETLTEDAGLFIHALSGFPGVYSSYVWRTIGLDGILKLMESKADRSAIFKSSVSFGVASDIYTFVGVCEGRISTEKRGSRGFGFDPIFIPKGCDQTFAEMTVNDKNRYSHRSRALTKFAEWYLRHYS